MRQKEEGKQKWCSLHTATIYSDEECRKQLVAKANSGGAGCGSLSVNPAVLGACYSPPQYNPDHTRILFTAVEALTEEKVF